MKRNLFAAGYWDAVDVTGAVLHTFAVTTPPVPVERICRDLKLRILTESMYPLRAKLTGRVIHISPMSEARRRFYLAHELGHFLLPKDYHEFSMNTFASCLIIPHAWLMQNLPVRSVAALSDTFGVTLPVMTLRLRHIGVGSTVEKPF